MVSRTLHRRTVRQSIVWVALVAFCLCLFAASAFPRSRPYDVKSVTHVQRETDEGGWAGGERYQGRSEASEVRAIPFSPFNLGSYLAQLWISIIDQPQPPVEPQTTESAQW